MPYIYTFRVPLKAVQSEQRPAIATVEQTAKQPQSKRRSRVVISVRFGTAVPKDDARARPESIHINDDTNHDRKDELASSTGGKVALRLRLLSHHRKSA